MPRDIRRHSGNESHLRLPLDHAALFFDVDGTLLELKEHPAEVVADPPLLELLERLRARVSGAVALVSGRALGDLDRIFAPMTFPAAALHGAEIRFPGGISLTPETGLMDEARPQAATFVALHPGLLLEDKGAAIAIHFRRRPELGADVLRFATELSSRGDLAVQEGKFVIELKPPAVDKGGAIRRLLERRPFAGRRPYFFGDDLTDETGFIQVNALGGVSARIGDPTTKTAAQLHLADVASLRSVLAAAVTP